MSLIHYNTPAIDAAASEIAAVAARTADNHQQSLSIVASNAENFGGQGSMAFQEEIGKINTWYAQDEDLIRQAGLRLAQANESMTQADASCANQYGL